MLSSPLPSAPTAALPRSHILDNDKRQTDRPRNEQGEQKSSALGSRREDNNMNTALAPPPAANKPRPQPASWKMPSASPRAGGGEDQTAAGQRQGGQEPAQTRPSAVLEPDPNCNEPSLPCLCCDLHSPDSRNDNHNNNGPRRKNNNTISQQGPQLHPCRPPLAATDQGPPGLEREGTEEQEEGAEEEEEDDEDDEDEDDTLVPSCGDCPPSLLDFSLSSSSSSISSCSDFESDSPDPLSPPDSSLGSLRSPGTQGRIVSPEPQPADAPLSPDEGYPSARCSPSPDEIPGKEVLRALPLRENPEFREGQQDVQRGDLPPPDSLAPSPLQVSPPRPGMEGMGSGTSSSSLTTVSPFSSPESESDRNDPALRDSQLPSSFFPYRASRSPPPPPPPPRRPRNAVPNIPSGRQPDDPGPVEVDRSQAPAPLPKTGKAPPPLPPPPSFLALDAEICRLLELAGLSRHELPGLSPEPEGPGSSVPSGSRAELGFVDRLPPQPSPPADCCAPEPPRKTSFHEMALRRKRGSHAAAPPPAPPPAPPLPPQLPPAPSTLPLPPAPRPDRSDWLIVFSPDAEVPPQPFGSTPWEQSPQKQAGSKVTTFKELRNRSKQNQNQNQPCQVQPGPRSAEPAPRGPDPALPCSEAGQTDSQSQPCAEPCPLPPAQLPPTFYLQSQAPSSLAGRHIRPGALQPIAEGSVEPEPCTPPWSISPSSDSLLLAPGGKRAAEEQEKRGHADGARNWERRATVPSPPLPLRQLLCSPSFLQSRSAPEGPQNPCWRIEARPRQCYPELATGGRQALLPWDPETPAAWSSEALTPPPPVGPISPLVLPRLSPIGAYSPPHRAGLPLPGADLSRLCSPLFPRSRTLPCLALGPTPAPRGAPSPPDGSGLVLTSVTRPHRQSVRSASFSGSGQVGGAWMASSTWTPPGNRGLSLPCLQEKKALVSGVSVAVEAVLSQFSSSRTLVQKAQSGDSSINPSVGRLVLQCLCPALCRLLSDSLKPYQSDLIAGRRPNSPWGLVQASTRPGPCTQALSSLQRHVDQLPQLRLNSQRFNAFLLGLLNLKLLDFWLSHLQSCEDVLVAHYSPASFMRLARTSCQPLFEELLLLLQPLALLTFHLDLLFEHHHLDPRTPPSRSPEPAGGADQEGLGISPAKGDISQNSSAHQGGGQGNQEHCTAASANQEHKRESPTNQTAGRSGTANQKSEEVPADQGSGYSRQTANGSPGPGPVDSKGEAASQFIWEAERAPSSVGRVLSQQASQAIQHSWGSLLRWGERLGQTLGVTGSVRTQELSQDPQLHPGEPSGTSLDTPDLKTPCSDVHRSPSKELTGRPGGVGADTPRIWLGRLFGASKGHMDTSASDLKATHNPLRRPSSWLVPGVSVLTRMASPAQSSPPEGEQDRPRPRTPRSVRTLCDHQGTGAELSFKKGEELLLIGGVDEEWIRCRQGDREGLVPIGYASLIM
ncbi:AP-4 complex accessory subunit RUSC1 isoform X2 [Lepisosteus oculatus]|uniref:AP-4 complex accessory subunit RUSC1 isoform X2 n=1 Tax=Lepisosteus oculatus TaxID=7918 RepID=UPI003719603B